MGKQRKYFPILIQTARGSAPRAQRIKNKARRCHVYGAMLSYGNFITTHAATTIIFDLVESTYKISLPFVGTPRLNSLARSQPFLFAFRDT